MGQAQGRELPFDIGASHSCLAGKTVWTAHDGTRKSDGEPVTVFAYDLAGKTEEEVKLVRSAHLRLKTLRHPNILRYIDGVELPDRVCLVTEKVTPLEEHLNSPDGKSQFSTAWGLHQILKGLAFLSNDCSLVHNNVNISSIFVDVAGEWKLGGVEFMASFSDSTTAPSAGKILSALRKYDPPEAGKQSGSRKTEKWSVDMWGLGCLLWELFNGSLTQVSALRNTSKLPKSLIPHYMECVSANPKSRPNPTSLLARLREHGGFLATPLISIALRIEELQIMEPSQRNEFFTELNSTLDSFPEAFSRCKILPQLINAFEFGGAGSAVLAPLFRLGRLLGEEEYQKKIVPCVVKLFSSTDRATRLNLLKQLENFIDNLQSSTVSDQIFPNIASGFTDTVPALREQTVKSMVLVAPKLNDSVKNTQLLKYLAKCQMDEQPGIRTNTTICLGRIASYLSASTRQKVLVSAFLRPLKDPFPPARCAAIGAIASTHNFYTTSDIASRLLPALCGLTVDKEKAVRDEVFKTIKIFLGKLEKFSEDPEAAAQQEKQEAAATSWTGWAVSSITSKFYKSGGGGGEGVGRDDARPAPPPAHKTEMEKTEKGTASRESEVREREEGDRAMENKDEGWDEDEWEDFNISGEQLGGVADSGGTGMGLGKDGSGIEEWEDDGWGMFESLEVAQDVPSSGADFFDSLSPSKKTEEKEDLFERLGVGVAERGGAKKKPSPPLVSSSLFGSSSGAGGGGEEVEVGGWGDWDSDFSSTKPPVRQQEQGKTHQGRGGGLKLSSKHSPRLSADTQTPTAASSHTRTTASSAGWDFDSDWGSFNTPSSSSSSKQQRDTNGSPLAGQSDDRTSRQEELQRKREERRQRQQEAREKRAAGVGRRPGGLGAVKKD